MRKSLHKNPWKALQAAQSLALENGQMQIEPVHLLATLTRQQDGMIGQMLQKMQLDPQRGNAVGAGDDCAGFAVGNAADGRCAGRRTGGVGTINVQ